MNPVILNTLKSIDLFIVIIFILSVSAIGVISYYFINSNNNSNNTNTKLLDTGKSSFENVIPYIAQSVFLNVYSPAIEYDKYKFYFKANLKNNVILSNGYNTVFIPKTVSNIPINLFQTEEIKTTKIFINGNGLSKEIPLCDVEFTTF